MGHSVSAETPGENSSVAEERDNNPWHVPSPLNPLRNDWPSIVIADETVNGLRRTIVDELTVNFAKEILPPVIRQLDKYADPVTTKDPSTTNDELL
jgi:hypothetical protein